MDSPEAFADSLPRRRLLSRCRRVLARCGLRTPADVRRLGARELAKLPGIGPKGAALVMDVIDRTAQGNPAYDALFPDPAPASTSAPALSVPAAPKPLVLPVTCLHVLLDGLARHGADWGRGYLCGLFFGLGVPLPDAPSTPASPVALDSADAAIPQAWYAPEGGC